MPSVQHSRNWLPHFLRISIHPCLLWMDRMFDPRERELCRSAESIPCRLLCSRKITCLWLRLTTATIAETELCESNTSVTVNHLTCVHMNILLCCSVSVIVVAWKSNPILFVDRVFIITKSASTFRGQLNEKTAINWISSTHSRIELGFLMWVAWERTHCTKNENSESCANVERDIACGTICQKLRIHLMAIGKNWLSGLCCTHVRVRRKN